jgi:hypothetical protein
VTYVTPETVANLKLGPAATELRTEAHPHDRRGAAARAQSTPVRQVEARQRATSRVRRGTGSPCARGPAAQLHHHREVSVSRRLLASPAMAYAAGARARMPDRAGRLAWGCWLARPGCGPRSHPGPDSERIAERARIKSWSSARAGSTSGGRAGCGHLGWAAMPGSRGRRRG